MIRHITINTWTSIYRQTTFTLLNNFLDYLSHENFMVVMLHEKLGSFSDPHLSCVTGERISPVFVFNKETLKENAEGIVAVIDYIEEGAPTHKDCPVKVFVGSMNKIELRCYLAGHIKNNDLMDLAMQKYRGCLFEIKSQLN